MLEIGNSQIVSVSTLIKGLYEHVHLNNLPNDAPYRGLLAMGKGFILDEEGYEKWYRDLMTATFALPRIAAIWSEDGIRGLMHELIVELAENKSKQIAPNFDEIARNCIAKIDVEFEETESFLPVIGLALQQPLSAGSVTLLPLDMIKERIKGYDLWHSFDDLSPNMSCVAQIVIKTEAQRSVETLREKTEFVVNLFRFVSSIMYKDGPVTPIYVKGNEPRRISRAVTIDSSGRASSFANSVQSPVPLVLNESNQRIADFYGLGHLLSLVGMEKRSPLEDNILTAIQWFGDATQDIVPAFAFVKFYIALETVTKKQDETAGSVLPARVSRLLAPFERDRRKRLLKSLKRVIDERDAIFHGGEPSSESFGYLEWVAKRFARSTIHEVRQLVERERLKTKDELTAWIRQIGRPG
jgi:hypothetical protein